MHKERDWQAVSCGYLDIAKYSILAGAPIGWPSRRRMASCCRGLAIHGEHHLDFPHYRYPFKNRKSSRAAQKGELTTLTAERRCPILEDRIKQARNRRCRSGTALTPSSPHAPGTVIRAPLSLADSRRMNVVARLAQASGNSPWPAPSHDTRVECYGRHLRGQIFCERQSASIAYFVAQ